MRAYEVTLHEKNYNGPTGPGTGGYVCKVIVRATDAAQASVKALVHAKKEGYTACRVTYLAEAGYDAVLT